SSPFQPPVSQERAILETFFHALSQFAFDKAKDQVEKERDSRKTLAQMSMWVSVLNSLSHLASAEKIYFSLAFIARKFFRKDTLRDMYKTLLVELKKTSEVTPVASHSVLLVEGSLLAELSRHLTQFVQARMELMDFYEVMASIAVSPVVNYTDLVIMVDELIHRHQNCFHHPILDPVKSSFSFEVEILLHSLRAQCEMCELKFLPSLLHLHASHTKLTSWSQLLPALNSKESLFSSGPKKQMETPFLYLWISKLHAALVSKFTLYFYPVLTEQTTTADMKVLTARATVDYIAKITAFQRRSDALNVSVLLDARGLDSYSSDGYHFPQDKRDQPAGLGAFPAVVSFPGERPLEHWPNIISIMMDRAHAQDLASAEKVVYFFDNRVQSTYFLTRIDSRLTLVVIFNSKRNEKDSYITSFMSDMALHLRNTKVFAMLKPGAKA
ncbi:predicted protein, partial [Nematostella vectensis]